MAAFTISYPRSHYPPSACRWGGLGRPYALIDAVHTGNGTSLIACSMALIWHSLERANHSLPCIRRELEMSQRHSDSMTCGGGGGSHRGLAADESWVTASQIDNFPDLFIGAIGAAVMEAVLSCFVTNALHATYPCMDWKCSGLSLLVYFFWEEVHVFTLHWGWDPKSF